MVFNGDRECRHSAELAPCSSQRVVQLPFDCWNVDFLKMESYFRYVYIFLLPAEHSFFVLGICALT